MKPQLTERSDVSCLAECDPALIFSNGTGQTSPIRFGRCVSFMQQRRLAKISAGFNSDGQVMSPWRAP